MNAPAAAKAAWAVGMLGVGVWLVLVILNPPATWDGAAVVVIIAASAVAFLTVGALVVARQPANRMGVLILLGGLVFTATIVSSGWADRSLIVDPGSLPFGESAAWVSRLLTPLALGVFIPIFLLFPDGKPPSSRWWIVWWVWVVGVAAATFGWVTGLEDFPLAGTFEGQTTVSNPTFLGSWAETIAGASGLVLFACAFATGAAVVLRFRRARGVERQQLRWLAFVGVTFLITFALPNIFDSVTHVDLNGPIGEAIFIIYTTVLLIGLPVAIGIAILKYHLYDLDVVIRKTVVVGVLAVFVTVAYVVIVVGIGSLIDASLTLRIVATAIVALAFQPARERANRLANRLVYGKRATPYETLARFSDRVGGTYSSDDVLARIAHVIADGTTSRTDVWLRIGGTFRRSASWPAGDAAGTGEVGEMQEIDGDHVAPVVQRGEILGAIAVSKDRAEPLTPNDAELVDRLAEQAGLVVANARLTADLEARLEDIGRQAAELRASRQRIVAAQDEERRRLERNIHDGAQQHLVALAVKIRLARTMLERDPAKGLEMIAELRGQVDAAIDTIRSLSLGVYPPLLEKQGLAAALAAQYTTSGLPVRMQSDGLGRYPIEIEAALYFCVLEALQNAAKYAAASAITVTLAEGGGTVEFQVADDGGGFDPRGDGAGTGLAGMRDRLAVFGGSIHVESAPGRGTIVRGTVPAASEVAV